MNKRLLSLLLAVIMLLSMVPAMAFAAEHTVESVAAPLSGEMIGQTDYEGVPEAEVILSLSHDDAYWVGSGSDAVMALKRIKVPYFDLALYGLEEYYFQSESYGDDGDGLPGSDLEPGTAEYAYGKVTLLHLYIYITEVYYLGINAEDAGMGYLYEEGYIGTDAFTISGGVGSSFLNQFWGGDCNLNYYVNYEYPLASEGWGATSDQILLREGDIITLGHFTGWNFYGDSASIFNYITADTDTVTQGEALTLQVMRAGANMGMTDGTAQTPVTDLCPEVYYCAVDELSEGDVYAWNYLGDAEADGSFVLDTSELEPGEYIIAIPGQYGVDYPDEICSTPGGMLLTVESASGSDVLLGDVDGDSQITGNDVLMIQRYVAKLNTEIDEGIADVDGDGSVTGNDVLLVQRYVAKLISSFPAGAVQ